MSDQVHDNLSGCQLSPVDRILPGIPVEDPVQLRHFRNPATVHLSIKFNRELHEVKVAPGRPFDPVQALIPN